MLNTLKDKDKLKALPAATADVVRPWLGDVTAEQYRVFLRTMYHYTKNSGDRLRMAASRCSDEAGKTFFKRMAKEENGHYQLAAADLKALNDTAQLGEAAQAIKDFEAFWDGINDTATYLGALYVLEGVGEHLGEAAVTALTRLQLQKTQARFVLVHLQDDIAHAAATNELCERFFETEGARVLAGAEQASYHWAAILKAGLVK